MVTGVSEKERGREREKKKIIITFHSVTKKELNYLKQSICLKDGLLTFQLGNKTFTRHSQFVKERIHKCHKLQRTR